MTPKKFIQPFINEENIKNQQKLILKTSGLQFLKPKFYKINSNEVFNEQLDIDNLKSTKFGTPIFDVFSFNCTPAKKIVYKASKEFGGGDVVLSDRFTFDTALIEVNQTKNIVRTAVAGTDGTIKEYMSEGDNIINLKGVIVGDTANQRPNVSRLNALVAYLKAPSSIPIACSFLEELIINNVVIESYKLNQREGARNIIDVEINMLSDSPIELAISKEQKDIYSTK